MRWAGVEPPQPRGLACFTTALGRRAQRRKLSQWHRRESNPQSPRFELGRFADLRTVPCSSKASPTGFGPVISCVTGRRALQAAPRGHDYFSGSGGTRTHSIPGSKPRWSAVAYRAASAQSGIRTRKRSGLGRAALPCWRIWAEVVPDGVEPSFPWVWTKCRCRWTTGPCSFKWSHRESHPNLQHADAGVFLLDHDPMFSQRKPWDSNPQAAFAATCFQDRLLIRPDGFRRQAAGAGIEPT